MTNFLDFHKKVEPQVEIVYKTDTQQRPWHADLIEVLFIVFIVSTIIWGVSRADDMQKNETVSKAKTFGVIGIVSTIVDNSLSIDNVGRRGGSSATSYMFDTNTVQKVETNKYVPLQLSDIKVGDKIIVQGVLDGDSFVAHRIISFGSTASSTTVATTTAPLDTISTNIISTSTSLDDVSSSTTQATTTNETATTTKEDVTVLEEEIATPTTTPEVVQDVQPAPDVSADDNATSTE